MHPVAQALIASAALAILIGGGKALYEQGKKTGVYYAQIRDDDETEHLAIKHDCGQYNPKTGIFEWLDSPRIDLSELEPLPVHDKRDVVGNAASLARPYPAHKPQVPK